MDIIKFIKTHEGGYCEVKGDNGGATNKGITLALYQHYYGAKKTKFDLKKLTDEQWQYIFNNEFWNKNNCDKIQDNNIANMLVDFAFNSGNWAAKKLQQVLGLTVDGIIGTKSLQSINNYPNQEELFNLYKNARMQYLCNIVKAHPNQKKFLNGWLKRVDDIKYEA